MEAKKAEAWENLIRESFQSLTEQLLSLWRVKFREQIQGVRVVAGLRTVSHSLCGHFQCSLRILLADPREITKEW